MSTSEKRPAGKTFLFTAILLLIFFVVIELICSIFLYYTGSHEKLATIEVARRFKAIVQGQPNPVNVDHQNLVRPDSSEAVNRQIAEETHHSNKFVYQPWVEFRNIDFAGKYVNVHQSIRRSSPDHYFAPGSTDTLEIYFFGGSTTFGFNIADAETIPSQFVQLYKQKNPNGPSIRVSNYATPTYYSYQELIQFSTLVFKGHRPDLVIFLDGVNDFWFSNASYYNQTYFSPVFRQVFEQRTGGSSRRYLDSTGLMFKDPENIPATDYYQTLIEQYYRNIRNVNMMAEMIGAKSFFFCQPVPFYEYPNQQQDPICFKDTNTRFSYIYPVIEKDASRLPNFTFLGNLLRAEKGTPFVDGLHYSPAFIREITAVIYDRIFPGSSQ